MPNPIIVTSTITFKPGSDSAIRDSYRALREGTLKEKGCITYDLYQSLGVPNTYVFVEKWESREAIAAHMNMEHVKAWRAIAAPLIETRLLEIIHPERIETP